MTIFHQNIISIYGESGRQWLDQLPVLVVDIAESWGLNDLKPMGNLTYNYVLSGLMDDTPIILKMGLDVEGLKREACALRAFEGHGSVKVLKQKDGAILLERAIPGNSLSRYFPEKEEESIQIICDLIKKLHQAPIPTEHFPHIRDWLTAIDQHIESQVETHVGDQTNPIFTQALLKAQALKNYLLETSPQDVFLHGDLHHDNILCHRDSYVVIDPKGVIGDPAYEVAAFIRNPIPDLLDRKDATNIIKRRINQFSQILNMDENRIRQWCFVQAVLAWIWALEDGNDSNYFNRLTRVFDRMLEG